MKPAAALPETFEPLEVTIDLLSLVERVNTQAERHAVLLSLLKTIDEEGCIDELRDIINDPKHDDAQGEGPYHALRTLQRHASEAATGSNITTNWKGNAITLQPARLPGGALVRYADEHFAELQKHRKLVDDIVKYIKETKDAEELSDFTAICDQIMRRVGEARG